MEPGWVAAPLSICGQPASSKVLLNERRLVCRTRPREEIAVGLPRNSQGQFIPGFFRMAFDRKEVSSIDHDESISFVMDRANSSQGCSLAPGAGDNQLFLSDDAHLPVAVAVNLSGVGSVADNSLLVTLRHGIYALPAMQLSFELSWMGLGSLSTLANLLGSARLLCPGDRSRPPRGPGTALPGTPGAAPDVAPDVSTPAPGRWVASVQLTRAHQGDRKF